MHPKHWIVCLLFISTSCVAAEGSGGLDQTLRGVASDLAAMQKEIQSASSDAKIQQEFAGPRGFQYVTITRDNASLQYGADKSATLYSKATAGQTFKVVDKASDWYAVKLETPGKGIDAAWVNAADVTPNFRTLGSTTEKNANVTDRLYEQIMESVKKVKDKYDRNPYVSVSGFSVNVGIPPSVTVSFEFKK
jgi:hypothetical protein